MPSTLRPNPTRTLGADLERDRLTRRARRLDYVLRALRGRASDYERVGPVPPPLHQAITGFARELADDRRRLSTLDGPR